MTTKKKSEKIDNSIPDWFVGEMASICGENPDSFELGF